MSGSCRDASCTAVDAWWTFYADAYARDQGPARGIGVRARVSCSSTWRMATDVRTGMRKMWWKELGHVVEWNGRGRETATT